MVCHQFRIRNLCNFDVFFMRIDRKPSVVCYFILLPCRSRLSLLSEQGTVQTELILSSATLSAGIGYALKT